MPTARFLLSSDHLELLLAFEESKGLSHLAETLGKDPSVVSRGLQRLAEEFPVIVKVKGRWEITPLGRRANELSRQFIENQKTLFSSLEEKVSKAKITLDRSAVLVVVNAQQGLLDATQLGRNNSEAEKNIELLLKKWRERKLPIVHVKHISENPSSIFYRSSNGCDFLPEISPKDSEPIVEKLKSSAFLDTDLEVLLKGLDATRVVLAGFTANECIDATARDSSALGFKTYVVGDATAMFDLRSADGKLLKAERIHRLTLANIGAFYGVVLNMKDLV